MTKTDKATLEIIFRTGFTFKGDSHWSSFRQATVTLNRLMRMGLVCRNELNGGVSYTLTNEGREAHLWPHSFQMALAA